MLSFFSKISCTFLSFFAVALTVGAAGDCGPKYHLVGKASLRIAPLAICVGFLLLWGLHRLWRHNSPVTSMRWRLQLSLIVLLFSLVLLSQPELKTQLFLWSKFWEIEPFSGLSNFLSRYVDDWPDGLIYASAYLSWVLLFWRLRFKKNPSAAILWSPWWALALCGPSIIPFFTNADNGLIYAIVGFWLISSGLGFFLCLGLFTEALLKGPKQTPQSTSPPSEPAWFTTLFRIVAIGLVACGVLAAGRVCWIALQRPEGMLRILKSRLKDSDQRVRAHAAHKVMKLPKKKRPLLLPELTRALLLPDSGRNHTQGSYWSLKAIQSMGGLAAPAVDALHKTLHHSDRNMRIEAANTLGALGAGAVATMSTLLQQTKDPDVSVAQAMHRALQSILQKLGPNDFIQQKLLDKAPATCQLAIHFLNDSDGMKEEICRVMSVLVQLLDSPYTQKTLSIAKLVDRCKEKATTAIPALLRHVDKHYNIRRLLSQLGPKAANASFKKQQEGIPATQRAIIETLLMMPTHTPTAPIFTAMLQSKNHNTKLLLLNTMSELLRYPAAKHKDLFPILLEQLSSPSSSIRAAAEKLLKRIGPPIVPLVSKALTHRLLVVRFHAASILSDKAFTAWHQKARLQKHKLQQAYWLYTLRDKNPETRHSSIGNLRKAQEKGATLPTTAVANLIYALGDRAQKDVRADAAVILGRMGARGASARPALQRATKDSEDLVRMAATHALTLLKEKQK